ncbi:MAG: ElyC/SanA/YdcF family protein [Verrucomicrobiota bacterium]
MLFWLKKFVSFWIMPLPFCVLAMLIGLVLLRWSRRPRLGRTLFVTGFVLLLLFSNDIVSRWLIRPLETRYPAFPEFVPGQPPPAQLAGCTYVVVLGGGNGFTPNVASTTLLSSSSLSRIVEGVRILKVLPGAKLIVSGPKSGDFPSHATALARSAESLGIAPDRIVYIETARDTEDEAHAVRKLAGDDPVALVTSSWHMPRAMALVKSTGLNAVACPTDFQTHAMDTFYFGDLFWDGAALQRSTAAIRERIGYLWIWLRGKT